MKEDRLIATRQRGQPSEKSFLSRETGKGIALRFRRLDLLLHIFACAGSTSLRVRTLDSTASRLNRIGFIAPLAQSAVWSW